MVAYDAHHLHLNVDPGGKVISITIFRPSKVELGGVQLLGRKMTEVESDLSKGIYRFVRVDAGLWCEAAGVLLIEVHEVIDGVEVLKDV